MKKLFLITLVSTMLGIFVTSCEMSQEKREIVAQQNVIVTKFENEGHKYIRFSWHGTGPNVGVVHDPNCPCQKNN